MRVGSLFAVLTVAFLVADAFALDGKAAVALMRERQPFYGPQPDVRSRLLVARMSGSSVTQTDTILRGGPFYFPTWSFDGTRIAFYRKGGGVSVIDENGNNLRTVAMIPDWGSEDLEQSIAWPAVNGGNWVYYHTPCNGCYHGGSGEIWKVNVQDTAQKVKVCDYKKTETINAGDPAGPGMWKFSLSADAAYAAVHTNGTTQSMGYSVGIIPHTFPPRVISGTSQIDPNLTEPRCTGQDCYYSGDCNSALSASGKVLYHLRGGHCQLYAHSWEHTGNTIGDFITIGTGMSGTLDQYKDIEAWTTSGDVGACFIWPRGVSNSDQIVTIICAYQYSASYGHSSCGSNLVVANWKDKEAILATNNPEPPHPSGYVPDGNEIWFVDPGDFWLAGGPSGCYEDVNGAWVNLSSVDAIGGRSPAGVSRAALSRSANVYTVQGKLIGSWDRAATPARLPAGAFVISPESGTRAAIMGVLPGRTDGSAKGR